MPLPISVEAVPVSVRGHACMAAGSECAVGVTLQMPDRTPDDHQEFSVTNQGPREALIN